MQPASEAAVPGIGHNRPSVSDILRDTQSDLIAEVDALAAEANAVRDELFKDLPEDAPKQLRSDEERDRLVGLAVRAGKLAKKVGETRLTTTKPLREEVEETNKFFNTIQLRPDRIKEVFESLINDYDRERRRKAAIAAAKAAEAAKVEAERKLAEAAASQHSVVGDVVMEEAVAADERARKLASEASKAGSCSVKTDAGATIIVSKEWTYSVEDWAKLDLRELRDAFTPDEIEKAIRKHIRAHRDTRPLSGVRIFQDETTRLRG